MVDVVSREKRSEMMSGIRGKNTRPETLIRSALHRRGYRYRLHVKYLAGKPDLVFSKFKAVIQVNGCFWHGHNCHLFKMPSTRTTFWSKKIKSNVINDIKSREHLIKSGWRVLYVWECAIKGKHRLNFDSIISSIEKFLCDDSEFQEIRCEDPN